MAATVISSSWAQLCYPCAGGGHAWAWLGNAALFSTAVNTHDHKSRRVLHKWVCELLRIPPPTLTHAEPHGLPNATTRLADQQAKYVSCFLDRVVELECPVEGQCPSGLDCRTTRSTQRSTHEGLEQCSVLHAAVYSHVLVCTYRDLHLQPWHTCSIEQLRVPLSFAFSCTVC